MVRVLALLAALLIPLSTLADVLFEGYSKVNSGGVPVGYTIVRYEVDAKTKKYTATTFTKTGSLGSDITESLKAVADEDLKPISYSYTSIVGKTTKTIDAKFKKNHMDATVDEGGKKKTVRLDLPKGAFLSSFLVYLMMKSKTGLKTDSKYEYEALAEEDAALIKGEAFVGKMENRNAFEVFKVLNKFKDMKFISYINDHGEVLETSSPSNSISTELVAKPADAVANFGTSPGILKSLFGDVPLGTKNIVSQAAMDRALAKPAEVAPAATLTKPTNETPAAKAPGK